MPHGLRTWDASGNLIIDVSTRLTRIIGTQAITPVDGSLSNADFALGTPFWYFTNVPVGKATPVVSFSGTTLTWTWPASTTQFPRDNMTLVYGVY